jgi:mono/diheme cytochrome c family protein
MCKFSTVLVAVGALVLGAVYALGPTPTVGPNSFMDHPKPNPTRGKALFSAAGCQGCHTDVKNKGALLAGGRAFKTPFGIYYSPNITPDKTHGIGAWSNRDLARALRDGLNPEGSHYFPVFPYPSYSGMSDDDIMDLKSYLFSLSPVAKANRDHNIKFPFGWRFSVYFWKMLFFQAGPFQADKSQSAVWNRGAYLVRHLTHCGECHSPRNALGGIDQSRELAGTADGPEGGIIPNISPHTETGIGKWSDDEIADLLTTGGLPDGDFVGDTMSEVVENSTEKLAPDDIVAIITYLKSLPPIFNNLSEEKKAS